MFIKNKEIVNKSAMLKLKLSFPNFSGLALHQWNYQFLETIARFIVYNPYKYCSRLSLNEHLYKTDTLTNGHLELVPAFLYSLYLTQDRHLFKMGT